MPAIYFIAVATGVILGSLLVLSLVLYPICLVRARGNLRRAARMQADFIFVDHTGWAIGIVVAVIVGWAVWAAAPWDPKEWTVQGMHGGNPYTDDSRQGAVGFACNTRLIDTGFILTSPSGVEEEIPAGADVCSGLDSVDP